MDSAQLTLATLHNISFAYTVSQTSLVSLSSPQLLAAHIHPQYDPSLRTRLKLTLARRRLRSQAKQPAPSIENVHRLELPDLEPLTSGDLSFYSSAQLALVYHHPEASEEDKASAEAEFLARRERDEFRSRKSVSMVQMPPSHNHRGIAPTDLARLTVPPEAIRSRSASLTSKHRPQLFNTTDTENGPALISSLAVNSLPKSTTPINASPNSRLACTPLQSGDINMSSDLPTRQQYRHQDTASGSLTSQHANSPPTARTGPVIARSATPLQPTLTLTTATPHETNASSTTPMSEPVSLPPPSPTIKVKLEPHPWQILRNGVLENVSVNEFIVANELMRINNAANARATEIANSQLENGGSSSLHTAPVQPHPATVTSVPPPSETVSQNRPLRGRDMNATLRGASCNPSAQADDSNLVAKQLQATNVSDQPLQDASPRRPLPTDSRVLPSKPPLSNCMPRRMERRRSSYSPSVYRRRELSPPPRRGWSPAPRSPRRYRSPSLALHGGRASSRPRRSPSRLYSSRRSSRSRSRSIPRGPKSYRNYDVVPSRRSRSSSYDRGRNPGRSDTHRTGRYRSSRSRSSQRRRPSPRMRIPSMRPEQNLSKGSVSLPDLPVTSATQVFVPDQSPHHEARQVSVSPANTRTLLKAPIIGPCQPPPDMQPSPTSISEPMSLAQLRAKCQQKYKSTPLNVRQSLSATPTVLTPQPHLSEEKSQMQRPFKTGPDSSSQLSEPSRWTNWEKPCDDPKFTDLRDPSLDGSAMDEGTPPFEVITSDSWAVWEELEALQPCLITWASSQQDRIVINNLSEIIDIPVARKDEESKHCAVVWYSRRQAAEETVQMIKQKCPNQNNPAHTITIAEAQQIICGPLTWDHVQHDALGGRGIGPRRWSSPAAANPRPTNSASHHKPRVSGLPHAGEGTMTMMARSNADDSNAPSTRVPLSSRIGGAAQETHYSSPSQTRSEHNRHRHFQDDSVISFSTPALTSAASSMTTNTATIPASQPLTQRVKDIPVPRKRKLSISQSVADVGAPLLKNRISSTTSAPSLIKRMGGPASIKR